MTHFGEFRLNIKIRKNYLEAVLKSDFSFTRKGIVSLFIMF